jgi:feruloyl esterase
MTCPPFIRTGLVAIVLVSIPTEPPGLSAAALAVEARDASVGEYAPLFMMPGVLHCAGGPGPDRADWASVIDDWVEKGQAPARIIASKIAADGTASRTRPLCPCPQRAVYTGTGSLDDEASFACR